MGGGGGLHHSPSTNTPLIERIYLATDLNPSLVLKYLKQHIMQNTMNILLAIVRKKAKIASAHMVISAKVF